MRLVKRDLSLLAEAYSEIYIKENQDVNSALLDYLSKNQANIKHYKKFAKVKAQQSKGGEQIQTTLDGRNETDVRTTNPGDWVVSNVESQGEQQIVDDKTFQKRYDVANPVGDIYSPKGANFYGVVYDGSLGNEVTFNPPNWGGSAMNITKGYMIGGPDPKNFNSDFYGIDPEAFKKTYKPAEMVKETINNDMYNSKDIKLLGECYGQVINEGKKPEAKPAPAMAPEAKGRTIAVDVFGKQKEIDFDTLMKKSKTIADEQKGWVELRIYETDVPEIGSYRDVPIFIPLIVTSSSTAYGSGKRPQFNVIISIGKAHTEEQEAIQELWQLYDKWEQGLY